jgi:hypothetical protein
LPFPHSRLVLCKKPNPSSNNSEILQSCHAPPLFPLGHSSWLILRIVKSMVGELSTPLSRAKTLRRTRQSRTVAKTKSQKVTYLINKSFQSKRYEQVQFRLTSEFSFPTTSCPSRQQTIVWPGNINN